MDIISNPPRERWDELSRRPAFDVSALFGAVRPIIEAVREQGDAALRELSLRFDHFAPESLAVSPEELAHAAAELPEALRRAIRQAHDNIERFHAAQRFSSVRVETAPGVICEQCAVPISKVGLYIPGGSAPLFSTVLMLGVPARLAGCGEVVLCTPPGREGKVHPAILYAAGLCGISRICRVGGAQAIAAMACGTESVPKVDKIFGPGNQYVMAAKQLVSLSGVAIDMPAGPSEVLVYADASCNPAFVAADLLSQAEHGPDSQVVLVTTSEPTLHAVAAEVERQLELLPRKEIATRALANSHAILFSSADDAIDFANTYAPEHLILAVADYRAAADRITHAGSVFLGNLSCESAGDYASGTNHTLPTLGYTRAYSGLCLDSFVRKITFQELSAQGIRSIGRTVELMAEAEQLHAHGNAMTLRLAACAAVPAEPAAEPDFSALIRPNIRTLAPYSSARDEYSGREAHVFLDANESPYNSPINRYPDPLQRELRAELAQVKGVPPECIFLGNGSDEAIDLVFRIFCEPGVDNVVAPAPTYGMYAVCADINGVEYRSVPLGAEFEFSAEALLAATDARTKVIFLCSPNNPTGNLLPADEVQKVLEGFPGIVVVDEAYGDFAPQASLRPQLAERPRLILLHTFSKAWAGAGIRLGVALAHPELIATFNKVKYPYNVNVLTQQKGLEMLHRRAEVAEWTARILAERSRLMAAVASLAVCRKVFPSEANFFLARVSDGKRIYDALVDRGIIVRNRSSIALCENCLRISVGTPQENDELLAALRDIDSQLSPTA